MYQSSKIAITRVKGGWDSMRTLEIMANGCIPWYDNIDKCPKNSITHMPKQLLYDITQNIDPMNPRSIPKINSSLLDGYQQKLLSHVRENLTSTKMVEYLLNTAGYTGDNSISKNDKIGFFSNNTLADYTRCMTLHGLKTLYGLNCVDSMHNQHMYEDYPDVSLKGLYGKGFTYSRTLNPSLKSRESHECIIDSIKNREFSTIIFGSLHRGLPYFELVKKYYSPDELIFICGEDFHWCSLYCKQECINDFGKKYKNVFVRELGN
jgi:hypothetical protein